jgi:hypothetical protein
MALGCKFGLWEDEDEVPLVDVNLMALYDAVSQIEVWNDDVFQQYLSLSFPQTPVATPYLEFYNWENTGSKSPPIGWFFRTGFRHSMPTGLELRGEEIKVSTDLSIGYSGPDLFGTSEGLAYYRAIIGTTIPLSNGWTMSPSVIGQLPGNQKVPFVEEQRLFFNLNFSKAW